MSEYRINPRQMNDIDRQKQIETDSLRDRILLYCRSRDYSPASDSKNVKNLLAVVLKPVADAILAEQLALKSPGRRRLPRYAMLLLSLNHEVLALITLCTLFNSIGHSEFEDGVAPSLVSAANEIGRRCLQERRSDCHQKREVDIARIVISSAVGRRSEVP